MAASIATATTAETGTGAGPVQDRIDSTSRIQGRDIVRDRVRDRDREQATIRVRAHVTATVLPQDSADDPVDRDAGRIPDKDADAADDSLP